MKIINVHSPSLIMREGESITMMEDEGGLGRTVRMGTRKITSVGKGVKKVESSCAVGGKISWNNHHEKQYRVS